SKTSAAETARSSTGINSPPANRPRSARATSSRSAPFSFSSSSRFESSELVRDVHADEGRPRGEEPLVDRPRPRKVRVVQPADAREPEPGAGEHYLRRILYQRPGE